MATFFEELLALDQPWVQFSVTVGGVEKQFEARKLNAAEADALDAFFSDEYARLIILKTEPQDGKASELDQVLTTYKSRPRKELIEQILGTRYVDVQKRALELAGIDVKETQERAKDMTPQEREALEAEMREAIEAATESAKEEIAAEYDSKTDADLAEIMAQVNINMKAMNEARGAQAAQRLFYMVHTRDRQPAFPSTDAVRKLSVDLLTSIAKAMDSALLAKAAQDLPFVSQGDPAPAGQRSSQANSEPGTPSRIGGRHTRRRRKNSKRFTTPS